MQNKEQDSRVLIAALEDAGYRPRSYSGRGMYGRECVAVTLASAYLIRAALADLALEVPEPEQDNMGKSYIFYWPSYPWPKE